MLDFERIKKKLLHKEIIIGMVMIILVIIFYGCVMYECFVGEKCNLKDKLLQQMTLSVGVWNKSESMNSAKRKKSYFFPDEYGLDMYVDGKKYSFKIDPTEDLFRVYTSIDCDMNLENSMTLACLDSLVKSRLGKDVWNMPVVFRRVDSLGNLLETYPQERTCVDMDEAGYVRLGYISGEKIGLFFDYSWRFFYKKFWGWVWGGGFVGAIIIGLIIFFMRLIQKYRRGKELQEDAFRQRIHDLKNPVAAVESILYNVYMKNPEAYKSRDGRDCYKECEEMLGKLKLDMSSVLGMAAMLHARRVAWKEIRLQEEVRKLIAEFKLAYQGRKEVNVSLDYRLTGCLMLSDLFLFALRNLIDNAVKYSGDVANITIACYEEGKKIVISVEDQGIGIDKKDLPYIYEEFRRVGKEKEVKGYGLGLAFVKKVVRKHGGKITEKSELGVGSKFIIKIHYHGKKDKAFVCGGQQVCSGELYGDAVRSGV